MDNTWRIYDLWIHGSKSKLKVKVRWIPGGQTELYRFTLWILDWIYKEDTQKLGIDILIQDLMWRPLNTEQRIVLSILIQHFVFALISIGVEEQRKQILISPTIRCIGTYRSVGWYVWILLKKMGILLSKIKTPLYNGFHIKLCVLSYFKKINLITYACIISLIHRNISIQGYISMFIYYVLIF